MNFEEFFSEWNNPEDYITVNTSGSTGEPKKISLNKDFVKESALRTNTFFGINENSRLHSCVSPDFIGGKMMAVRASLANAFFSWEQPSNQPLKDISEKENIDLLALVPSQMPYLIENINNLPTIKNIIIGGGPIHPSLREKIVISGFNAFETYGMTETASHIALRKISEEITPFTTFDDIKISKDLDDCLNIYFKNGYHIKTNDIVEIVSQNQFYVLGRKDNIINSGGKKINPVIIEEKISHLLPCRYLVTSFPDEKWGEKVVLLIETNPNKVNVSTLKENFKILLERWQMPKEIHFVKKLPLTPNGKIKRIKDPSSLVFVAPDTGHVSVEQNKQA